MNQAQNVIALASGTMLEAYRIVDVLGAGGFGITYLGEDVAMGRRVAIKEYLPGDLATRARDGRTVTPIDAERAEGFAWGLRRFIDEARTLARFEHANIVTVFAFFEANGTAYYVMRYVEGESLDRIVPLGSVLEEKRVKALLFPLLDGLEAVHAAGFLHRDIKPSNIFVRRDGTPILIDFGSARQALSGHTKTLTAVLSPGYAPFEQYHADGYQGPWTDLYALAATLYRCVAGATPIEATLRVNARARNRPDPLPAAKDAAKRSYDPALLVAIDAGLRINEEDRPQSVAEFRGLLERAAAAVRPASATRQPATVQATLVPDADAPVANRAAKPATSPRRSGQPPGPPAIASGDAAQGRAGFRFSRKQAIAGALALAILAVLLAVAIRAVVTPGTDASTARAFRDCTDCPEMISLPAGEFTMGSPKEEKGHSDDEAPQVSLTVARFAIGRYEVTVGEYQACVRDGDCERRYEPTDISPRKPVSDINWEDAQAYVAWLSRKSGKRYRLPSEAEWEYAARANTTTRFAWGDDVGQYRANCNGCGGALDGPTDVGMFPPNAFALHDLHGNILEWTEDCWNGSHFGRPRDAAARTRASCDSRVLRGGHWQARPELMRSAARIASDPRMRDSLTGFRVARDAD